MRVIKFRAWLRDPGRLIDLNGFDIAFDGLSDKGSVYAVHEQGIMVFYDVENVDLMQYTGLKDKNDTPIYEGDILNEPVSPVGGPDGGYRYKSRVIEWDGAGKGYGLFAPEAASIVIGNIHENPELLESTK